MAQLEAIAALELCAGSQRFHSRLHCGVTMITKSIARIANEGPFFEDFFATGRPVIVVGAANRMAAYSRWTDTYLRAVLAGLRPTVRFEDGREGRIPIDIFLDYLAAPERFSSSYGSMYLTDFYLRPAFGDARRETLALAAAFPLRRGGPFAEWISLYAGPAGTSTAWHQDIFSTHTWLALLRGEKRWHLSAPLDDPLASTTLRECVVYEGTMAAGDLIYLPPDWWHQVRNHTSTLAISGNFCTFCHAEAALAEARSSTSPRRDIWIQTWTEILAQRAENLS
jgi:JmjC domain